MEKSRWADPEVWFSGVVAFFTVVLVVVAWQQYRWMQLSERPLVSPVQRKVYYNDTMATGIDWTFKNGGKSPALNVRYNLEFRVGEAIPMMFTPETKTPTLPECESTAPLSTHGGFALPPGVDQSIRRGISPDALSKSDSINTNSVGLYWVGCVDYEDLTGKNHRTWVCEWYANRDHDFGLCPYGNKNS